MWQAIQENERKTVWLVLLLALLLFGLGYCGAEAYSPGAGPIGFLIAWAVWMVQCLVAYFMGDQIFLMMSGARKIAPGDHPVLYNVVEEMKLAAGLPKIPDVYIIDEMALNAFAVGRSPDRASVAVTAGLLEKLDRYELQGVIAHEIGHIKNLDVLFMVMSGATVGTIVLLADMSRHLFHRGGARRRSSSSEGGGPLYLVVIIVALLLIVLAPLLSRLLYYAMSRTREYLADASAVQFTRYPEGLASALEKLSQNTYPLNAANQVTAPMYIVNPLAFKANAMQDLSSTHPPIHERIEILRKMAGTAGLQDYNEAYKSIAGKPVGVIPFNAVTEDGHHQAFIPERPDTRSHKDRVRETYNAAWKMNQYYFLPCECGATLKIPPSTKYHRIQCPHCARKHDLTA